MHASKCDMLSARNTSLYARMVRTIRVWSYRTRMVYKIVFFIIITSNDDPKPSTVISEQLPTGLIARHIKITSGTIIS